MRKIKGIGFDLGETLVQYKGVPLSWDVLFSEAIEEMLEQCGCSPTEETIRSAEAVLHKYNTRENPRTEEVEAKRIIVEILEVVGLESRDYLNQAKDAFFGFFQRRCEVFEDTYQILEIIKDKQIKVGILTDVAYGMDRKYILKDIEPFQEYIDYMVTSVEAGYRKPHAKGYEMLAESLGLDVEDMMYVGNEEKDIIGAKNIGMTSVLINRSAEDKAYGADFVVNSLVEIDELL